MKPTPILQYFFGVWGQSNLWDENMMGFNRILLLIDGDGVVRKKVIEKVKPRIMRFNYFKKLINRKGAIIL